MNRYKVDCDIIECCACKKMLHIALQNVTFLIFVYIQIILYYEKSSKRKHFDCG